MNDKERLLILNMVEGVGSVRTRRLLEHFGSLTRVFRAKESEIIKADDIGEKTGFKIARSIREIDIREELDAIKKYGVRIVTFLDRDYPENLSNIYDPPLVLYVKGSFLPRDNIAVALVGSRRASFYGMQTSEKLGFELASRGVTVVSGLARGIDSAAHKGALRAKGRTLAVLGSGILDIYPEEHISLAEAISASGAVVSEFPMTMPPEKGNFPKRNRVISGLSMGVVVVEAAERSGALITSDIAAEQGREVFAVPGKIDSSTSRGTHKLIKQGAKLAETSDDILEELNLEATAGTKEDGCLPQPELDKQETLVYNLLSSEPRHIDELCEQSSLGVAEVSRILLGLEMKRTARQLPGKNFIRI